MITANNVLHINYTSINEALVRLVLCEYLYCPSELSFDMISYFLLNLQGSPTNLWITFMNY